MNKDVNEIIEIINKNNKKAYLVGGAVRDMVLGKEPHDYDITTNMSYEDLEKVFPKNYPSGKAFGIITIFYNDNEYEIAHFRNDGDYADNRHCEVILVDSVEEDLKRRDFTINAMAYNEKEGFIDPFGGKEDVEKKIIRAVGNPNERFNEDALRMMRAIRFSAQLGFDIEENTLNAIKNNAHLIKNISFERIEAEMTKMLLSDHPEKIKMLYDFGISKYIMPELDEIFGCKQNTPWHIYDVGNHTMKALENIEKDRILRWSILFHDFGKPDAKTTKNGIDHFYDHAIIGLEKIENVLNRLKFSNDDKNKILNYVQYHDLKLKKTHKIRYMVAKYGFDFFENLYKIQMADIEGQSDYKKEEKIESAKRLLEDARNVYEDKTAIKLKDLEINGNDLIKLGFKDIEIGAILNNFYINSLKDPRFNNKNKLIQKAKELKNKSLDDIILEYKKYQKSSSKFAKNKEER